MPNFVLQTPSLQHLAAVKIVAALWNHPDILKLIAETSGVVVFQDSKISYDINQTVKANAWALDLPDACKQQLLKLVVPLNFEINTWCSYHHVARNDQNELVVLKYSLPKQFCWSMLGTVDYAKTAQLMVKDESLAVERRYEIACVNCLEDEARELIPFIPEERRRKYINKALYGSTREDNHYTAFFTCILSGGTDQLNACFQPVLALGLSINHYLFERSVESFNPAKSEYFFNKLNRREKEFSLGQMASNCVKFPASIVVFYLSRMNEEQQKRMFRKCMGDLLVCLLNWPMQSLFLEAVECGWLRYTVYDDNEKVLRTLADKISFGDDYQDYNYSQLFWQCWSLTSADVKARLLDDAGFFGILVETKREEFIQLILNEASAHQILELCNNFHEKCPMWLDEDVMSEEALVKCKETAALVSSNDKEDEGKRLRSQHLSQLVDIAIEERETLEGECRSVFSI